MLLFALLCGGVVGRAETLAQHRAPGWLRASLSGRPLAFAVIAILLSATFWGGIELRGVAAVESAVREARFNQESAEHTEHAIGRLSVALKNRADDAEAHQCLARLWTHLYRLQTLKSSIDLQAFSGDLAPLWTASLPVVLHGRIHDIAETGPKGSLEALRKQAVVQENLLPALRHWLWARRCCPLLPHPHLSMAELAWLLGAGSEDKTFAERARLVAPADPEILFETGLVDLNAGRREVACASWQQSLMLSDRFLPNILKLSEERLPLLETVKQVLPDSPSLLLDFAVRKDYQAKQYSGIRSLLAERALAAIQEGDLAEDEKSHFRASALAIQENFAAAIAQAELAVRMRPYEVAWRYELALLLKHERRLEDARRHARTCSVMAPSRPEYEALLIELTRAEIIAGFRPEAGRE